MAPPSGAVRRSICGPGLFSLQLLSPEMLRFLFAQIVFGVSLSRLRRSAVKTRGCKLNSCGALSQ